jgi:N-acetylglucosamine repressor
MVELNKNQLQKKLIKILYLRSPRTIPEISKKLNKTIPTVTALIDDLQKEGIVQEDGVGDSSGGRKPILYGLNPDAGYIMAINIKSNYFHLAIFNLKNKQIFESEHYPFNLYQNPDTDAIIQNTKQLIASSKIDSSKIIGIGVCFPGLVDSKKGINYSYFHSEKPIRTIFEEKFKLPVFIENDTRVITLAEYRFGMARNKKNIITVYYDKGIGMGMIFNGEVYHGKSGFTGELGHVQIRPGGELCYCGKQGCLETLASGSALIKQAIEGIKQGKITQLSNYSSDKIDINLLIDTAIKGDEFCLDLLAKASDEMGRGLAILIHLLNPEMIIIGGRVSRAGKFILAPIQHAINKYTLAKINDDVQVEVSQLGENAIFLGTVSMVMDNILA